MTVLLLILIVACGVAVGWLIREHLALQAQVLTLSGEVDRLSRSRPRSRPRSPDRDLRRVQELLESRSWLPSRPQTQQPPALDLLIEDGEESPTDPGAVPPAPEHDMSDSTTGAK